MWGNFFQQYISVGLLLAFVTVANARAVDATYLDPARIDYTRPDATKQLELIDCFTNGNCTQDDKIRIYPMPCNGSGGADCTGCYSLRGGSPNRISDLNPSGTCAGMGQSGEQLLRVFVGYERKCPSGTATCDDGQLLLSCSISSEGDPGQTGNLLPYNKDCFAGQAYIRKARATIATISITSTPSPAATNLAQCPAGKTGTYPSCVPCSDTTYKPTTGSGACTACSSPVIANSAGVIYTTAGTTKTSASDCRVADFNCASDYTKNSLNKTCDDSSVCSMTFDITRSTSPTSSTDYDGGVSGLASIPFGGSVKFSITPTLGTVTRSSSTSGSANLFWGDVEGLTIGVYSMTATDEANPTCSITRSVTVTPPSPRPTPTPSPSPVCQVYLDVRKVDPSTGTANDGLISASFLGMMNGSVSFEMTPATGNITAVGKSFSSTGLGAGTYTLTATDHGMAGCSRTQTVTLSYSPPPPPAPLPSNPPCPSMQYLSQTQVGVVGTGYYITVIRLNSNILAGDQFWFMIHGHWFHVDATAGETPNSMAVKIANDINGRTGEVWTSGPFGRAPPAGTAYFPPVASATGTDFRVLSDFKTLLHVRGVYGRPGCPQ